MGRRGTLLLIAGALLAGGAAAVVAQGQFDKVEIQPEKLAANVWVLYGAGGNIGVCTGDDGVVLVDDQFAPLAPKIQAAVKRLSDRPLRWVINTHWHGDHVGGNEAMADAGATIVADDAVRRRMIAGQHSEFFHRDTPPAPAKALPVVTFSDSATLHVNGDDVLAFHVAPAHTDGDVIVWFRHANVVHMGDTFFNGGYPIVDLESGGSVDGMIAACDRVLPLLGPDTKVVPGHGQAGDRESLRAYRGMLAGVRANVAKLVDAGRSEDEAVAAKPTADWDAQWGRKFLQPDVFTRLVYTDLSARRRH